MEPDTGEARGHSLLPRPGTCVGATAPVECQEGATLARRRKRAASMQHRALEKVAPVARAHLELEGLALAVDEQRDLHAGLAQRPHAPKEAGQIIDRAATHPEHNVAG